MHTPILNLSEALDKIQNLKRSVPYKAMYSSWLNGIIKDPQLMFVPIDDHLVHRGDGVFEAMKFKNPQKVYLLSEHLARLQQSSERIGISIPMSIERLSTLIYETIRASELSSGLVRLFLSRGPGGFSTNPYESQGPQIYIVITDLQQLSEKKYEAGVRLGKSQWIAKNTWHAQIKSCNYLHNVMMKKEAVDRNLDFTVSFDDQGFLTEGSTENIVLVDSNGNLLHPHFERILKGTTMVRAFELAQKWISKGFIKEAFAANLKEIDLINAREVMLMGTTLDVLPVGEYEGKTWNTFPIATQLRSEILNDQK